MATSLYLSGLWFPIYTRRVARMNSTISSTAGLWCPPCWGHALEAHPLATAPVRLPNRWEVRFSWVPAGHSHPDHPAVSTSSAQAVTEAGVDASAAIRCHTCPQSRVGPQHLAASSLLPHHPLPASLGAEPPPCPLSSRPTGHPLCQGLPGARAHTDASICPEPRTGPGESRCSERITHERTDP